MPLGDDFDSPSSNAGGFIVAEKATDFPTDRNHLDGNLKHVYDIVRKATRAREGKSCLTPIRNATILRLVWIKANDPQWYSSSHLSPEERSELLQGIPHIGNVRGNTTSPWVHHGSI